ncbi:hypothetical protein WMF30_10390 [Sorangium sp. So ce134]
MAELDYPLVNNRPVSWARLKVQLSGANLSGSRALRGFRAISYKVTVERSPVRGAGRKPYGHTDGNVSYEASLTWIYETWVHLIRELGNGFMDKEIVVSLAYRLGIATNNISTVEIVANGMKEAGGDHSEGTEGLEMPMPLDVTSIKIDGKDPVEDPEF